MKKIVLALIWCSIANFLWASDVKVLNKSLDFFTSCSKGKSDFFESEFNSQENDDSMSNSFILLQSHRENSQYDIAARDLRLSLIKKPILLSRFPLEIKGELKKRPLNLVGKVFSFESVIKNQIDNPPSAWLKSQSTVVLTKVKYFLWR